MIPVFWQPATLTHGQTKLLLLLEMAHVESTFRQNPSSTAVQVAALGSNSYTQAIAAALMTVGGPHAPLLATFDLLTCKEPDNEALELLESGLLVPGWGSSFAHGARDPAWERVDLCLAQEFPAVAGWLVEITKVLHSCHKLIFPNPSAYTAAAAIALGIPRPAVAYLFIAARLPAWSELALKQLT